MAGTALDEIGHQTLETVGKGIENVIAGLGGWLDRITEKIKGWDPQAGKSAFAGLAEGMKEKFGKGNSQDIAVTPDTQKVGRSAEHAQHRSQEKDVTSVAIGHSKEKDESHDPNKKSDMQIALEKFKLTNDVKISAVNDNMELGNLSAPSVPTMAKQQQQGIGIG
jgi:hypothetical protein